MPSRQQSRREINKRSQNPIAKKSKIPVKVSYLSELKARRRAARPLRTAAQVIHLALLSERKLQY